MTKIVGLMVALGITESIPTKYLFASLLFRDRQNFYGFVAYYEYSTALSKRHLWV